MNTNIFNECIYPEDTFTDNFKNLQSEIINTLSENKLTISQTRYLFRTILSQFERDMPVTNHTI